jgi:glutaredoxin
MDKFVNALAMVQPGKVVVFSKTYCPYCDRAKDALKKLKIAFDALECDNVEVKSADLDKLSTMCLGTRTFPKIFVGLTPIGGCDALLGSVKKGTLWEILDNEKISYTKTSL